MRALILTLVFLGSTLTVWAEDSPVTVENSGSEEVDALVVKMVSKRPAHYPTGYHGLMMDGNYFITPEVEAAIQRLKSMGSRIFPALIEHLGDDRYSYSNINAAWVNYSVGAAVIAVLSDGTHCPYEYKSRNTPSGQSNGLWFGQYLEDRKPAKWVEWAKNKTRSDIQMDFLQWCFAKEKERGFVDDTQRNKITEAYEKAIAETKEQQKSLKQ